MLIGAQVVDTLIHSDMISTRRIAGRLISHVYTNIVNEVISRDKEIVDVDLIRLVELNLTLNKIKLFNKLYVKATTTHVIEV